MTAAVRSELRKYATTRMAWAMPVAMLLIGAAFAALQGLFLAVIGEFPGADGEIIRPAEVWDAWSTPAGCPWATCWPWCSGSCR